MASAKENEVPMLRQWYEDAGLEVDGEVHKAINRGLQSYRRGACVPGFEFIRQCGEIMDATIRLFTERNAQIERWPTQVRRMLNRTQGRSAQGALPEPFTTWARPRDLEKRKQAVAVWYNLIAFLVYHWEEYDERKMLERMGLKIRDERLRELIDDISLYSRIWKKTPAMTEAIENFCRLVLTDEHATPTSNPLLWWIAVLVQSEVLDSQPRLPILSMVDELDFEGKLDALDHYSRALMLHYALEKSPGYPSIYVVDTLDQAVVEWVQLDQERPPTDTYRETLILAHPEWTSLLSEIDEVVNKWSTRRSPGPMRTILYLKNGLASEGSLQSPSIKYQPLDPDPEFDVSHDGPPTGYKVMLHITEWFTKDPMVNLQAYPSTCCTKKTLGEANTSVTRVLKEELGGKKDALHWDKIIRSDGTVKIRAVFLNSCDNAKAMAWVDKSYEPMEFSSDPEGSLDSDDVEYDTEDSEGGPSLEAFQRAMLGNPDNGF